MIVRQEQPADAGAVRRVNLTAFETAAEADLVDTLRRNAQPVVSLVAEDNGEIVGHIMFTPVRLGDHADLNLMGLAPMAVLPADRRKGVGSALVHAGLRNCLELGAGAVVVLGHTRYYPRFGFQPSVRFGISSPYDAPPEAFMVLELQPGCLRGRSGTIRFHEAFQHA